MNSRLVQQIAKLLAIGGAYAAGRLGLALSESDTAALNSGALEVAVGIVAIGSYILDQLIHKLATGGIFKSAGTTKEKP